MRLYVVDDVPVVRRLVRGIAEGLGHVVVGEAADGLTACEQVPALAPDVVIIDWQMPRMDGLEATRILRGGTPAVPVIAFTSSGDDEIARAFLEAGAHACLSKDDVAGLEAALHELERDTLSVPEEDGG